MFRSSSTTNLPPRTDCKRAAVPPTNPPDRTRGRTQLPTVLRLLSDVTAEPRKSRDPSPLLRNPSVYTCRLATRTCLPQRCVAKFAARLSTARRKHLFVYCCVIAGTCCEVAVLAWSKYATILQINSR
jgi:hypothetical protein